MSKCTLTQPTLLTYVDGGEHLDGRDEHGLQPGSPPGRESRDRPVRVVGKPRRPTGDGVGSAQFRVRQREQRQHASREDPRRDRRRAGLFRCVERAEQPARSDDRPQRDEHQSVEAHRPLQWPAVPPGRSSLSLFIRKSPLVGHPEPSRDSPRAHYGLRLCLLDRDLHFDFSDDRQCTLPPRQHAMVQPGF
jgi:hypothetical protein